MKFLFAAFYFTSLINSCNHTQEIRYDIYSAVLVRKFQHLSGNRLFIILNDTIQHSKDELQILLYAVQNNEEFFKEYCDGDPSFKTFISGIKAINTDSEVVDANELKAKSKMNVTVDKLIQSETEHHSIIFSKIIFSEDHDKAIVFVKESSSGSWIFVALTGKGCTVKCQIGFWVACQL